MDFDIFATRILSKMHHHKMINKFNTGTLHTINTSVISTVDHHGPHPLSDLIPVLYRM